MADILRAEWFIWGVGLILSFQVAVVVLGEAIYRAERKGRSLVSLYRAARNGVLPLLVIYVFLSKIVELEPDSQIMRAIATLFWISVIYAVLLFVNILLFAQAAPGTWRARAPKLFQDLLRMLLVIIGAAIVLSVVWRRDLGGLVAALGVGSIVLGLALQETLGNLMAGIAMLFERPFVIGDWVKVGDNAGEVIQVNWRSVHLRTIDRNLLVIPNSALGRETFTNYSAPTRRQKVRVLFGFCLDVPPNKVKELLIETARNTPHVAEDSEPVAHAIAFEEDRIRYRVVLTLDNPKMYRALIDAYTTRVWYAAQRAGLQLPLRRQVLEHNIAGDVDSEAQIEASISSLQRVPVLAGLSREQLQGLADHAEKQWFGAGETVLQEGQMSEAVYIIESGKVCALHRGVDVEIACEILQLSQGDLFGENALTRGKPNPESLVADTDLEVLKIPMTYLEALIESNPHTAHQFANLIDMRANAKQRIVGAKS